MKAKRTTLIPSNDVWSTLSDDEKKRINKEEGDRVAAVEFEDEVELLRRVDAAGANGYRLQDGDVPMLLAAQRMCTNQRGRSNKHPIADLHEREPFVLVRRQRW